MELNHGPRAARPCAVLGSPSAGEPNGGTGHTMSPGACGTALYGIIFSRAHHSISEAI